MPSVTEFPFITVAMPVRNEERHIQKVLDALLSQDYPKDKYEIIVADGESTDQTRAIVERTARAAAVSIKLINNPRRLSSAGRNIGIVNGQGDVIAFVDGHCIIEGDHWLRNIADIMRETGAVCLCRPQPLDDPANSSFQDMIAKCRGSMLGHGLDSSIFDLSNERFINPTSSGAIYARQVFEKVGMYDEAFDACEDVELNHRVWQSGLKSYISPRLTVRYAPRTDVKGLFKQMMRYGQGRFRLIAKHRDAISLSQFVPPVFVAWMIFALLLAPFMLWARWVLFGTLALYFAAALLSSVVLAAKHGIKFLWGGLAIYPAIHVGLGIGFWKGFFSGHKPIPAAAAARSGV
jgi:succinoglycan biosynthesis protein ExoA